MESCCNQPCDVSHVNHEKCAHFVCDFLEGLEVDGARVCRCTGYDELRLVLLGHISHVVIVDSFVLTQTVSNEVI